MRSNDIQGSNFGGMGQRMQGGMNIPSFGGNSVNRGTPLMRSGMDRDFRGESRRSENSSFVIGGGDDNDVEEIMEDEQKFTGGFSKFENMSRGGSMTSNMRDSNSFGGFNNSSYSSFTSRGNNFGSNVNR